MAKKRISTARTTVVFKDGGYLQAIVVSGGTIGNITLYDDVSAVVENALGVIDAAFSGMVIPYELPLVRGLTIVTASATDLLVIYETKSEG